jgi:hypothetical protein
MTIRSRDGPVRRSFDLRAGRETAQGLYEQAAHRQSHIGRKWQTEPGPHSRIGYDYVAQFSWDTPHKVEQVEIQALPFDGRICIRGLALIDQRDGSSLPLRLNSRGNFELVHSGDVKIYRALDVLPRAHLVYTADRVDDDQQAVVALTHPDFDPSTTVVLLKNPGQKGLPSTMQMTAPTLDSSRVKIQIYQPEQIVIQVDAIRPGYLVLSDTWYPGWNATLDGQPVTIERANLAFRAIHVPQGSHMLHLIYRPQSYLWGLRISLFSLLVIAALLMVGVWQKARSSAKHTRTASRPIPN